MGLRRPGTINELVEPPFPRRLLRDVLIQHGTTLGARVLDAGCGQGELVTYLASLGFDATGSDESETEIETARQRHPESDFYVGSVPRDQFDDRARCFDLVLARNQSAWRGSFFAREAFLITAGLLSCIKRQGRLIFLGIESAHRRAQHDVLCMARHLAQFPGTCRIDRFPATSPDGATTIFTAALQLDDVRRSRLEWDRIGQAASAMMDGACCTAAHNGPVIWRAA